MKTISHHINVELARVIMDPTHPLPLLLSIRIIMDQVVAVVVTLIITTNPLLHILHHHTSKGCGSITSSSNIIHKALQGQDRSVCQVNNILIMSPCRSTPEIMITMMIMVRGGSTVTIMTITIIIQNKTTVHEEME